MKISMQHGTSGASAHAYAYLGFILGRSFTVTVMVIVSPSLHATWSRSTASSPIQAKVYVASGSGCLLDAADRDRDRFHADGLSHRDRDG